MAAAAHRRDVQGLRGVAVLLVVLFHTSLPVPGGFVGVDVFFVISGFVITRTLWRELESTGRVDLVGFYSARARRLLPALAVVLCVVAVAAAALQSPLDPQRQTARTGLGAAGFAANLVLLRSGTVDYFATPAESNPLLHTWTLGVEEQFYVGFPLLVVAGAALALRLRRSSRAGAATAVTTVLAGSLVACVAVTYASGEPMGTPEGNRLLAFYASPLRAWEFAVGALLALGEARLARVPRRATLVAAVVGVAAVAVAAVTFSGATPFPGGAAALPVGGAALVLAAGTAQGGLVTRLLSTPALTWIGDMSYGWYLWHWPAIVLTRTAWPGSSRLVLVLVAVATLVPTMASYRLVEQPIRADRSRRGGAALRLAAVCVAAPVLLHGALLLSVEHPTGAVRDLARQNRPHADVTRGCTHNLPDDAVTSRSCTWRAAGAPRGDVVLVGDSNAGQLAEPLAAAGVAAGYDVTLATYSGCPFALVRPLLPRPRHDAPCAGFVRAWADHLALSRPALVVVASASSTYLSHRDVALASGQRAAPARSETAKAQVYADGLRALLLRLADAGVPTLVVHPVPVFRSFDLHRCPAIRVHLGTCGEVRSRAEVDAHRRAAVEAERRAVAGVPGATTLDLADRVCGPARCATEAAGRWIYRDINHLTVDAALELTPVLADELRRTARPARADGG